MKNWIYSALIWCAYPSFLAAQQSIQSSTVVQAPGAPARTPQIAVRGTSAGLTFGAANAIYFSRSTNDGLAFEKPVKVAEAPILPLTRHRGPRLAFANSALVITAVTGKTLAEGPHAHGLPSDGNLLAWRSVDGGKTWSKPVVVNDIPGAAKEGLHSLASDPSGRLFAVWLDKRGQGTKLYGSRSDDGGASWSKNILVYESPDGTICECCHPSVAFDSKGNILVMWRNWLAGSRDLYLAKSADGVHFSNPGKLGQGTWKLNACPMDGGGIAVVGDQVFSAWRRERSVYVDRLNEPELALGEGNDVAIDGGPKGAILIWSTPQGLMTWKPGDQHAVPLNTKGAYPSIAALPEGGAVAAWEDNGQIVTRRLQ